MPDQIIDLATLSDEDLDSLRTNILTEQERRQRIASTPGLVADTARRYIADGGDKADLVAALDNLDVPNEEA